MPELPPKQMILLSEAVLLTGKNESTIRRYFKKPENKLHTVTKAGKVYVDREHLLRQYAPVQTPELPPESTPKQTPEQSPAIESAIQALISQLDAKDRQIEGLQERLRESNINLQTMQRKLPERATPPEHDTPAEKRVNENEPRPGAPYLVPVLIGIAVALLLLVGWMIYQQSASAAALSKVEQSREVPDSYVKKLNQETDTAQAAPVPMDSTIKE